MGPNKRGGVGFFFKQWGGGGGGGGGGEEVETSIRDLRVYKIIFLSKTQ